VAKERKTRKKKKETSAVKYNTSGHYRGWRYKYHTVLWLWQLYASFINCVF